VKDAFLDVEVLETVRKKKLALETSASMHVLSLEHVEEEQLALLLIMSQSVPARVDSEEILMWSAEKFHLNVELMKTAATRKFVSRASAFQDVGHTPIVLTIRLVSTDSVNLPVTSEECVESTPFVVRKSMKPTAVVRQDTLETLSSSAAKFSSSAKPTLTAEEGTSVLTISVRISMSVFEKIFHAGLELFVKIFLDGTNVLALFLLLEMPTDLKGVDHLFMFASMMQTALTDNDVTLRLKNALKELTSRDVNQIRNALTAVDRIMTAQPTRNVILAMANVTIHAQLPIPS